MINLFLKTPRILNLEINSPSQKDMKIDLQTMIVTFQMIMTLTSKEILGKK